MYINQHDAQNSCDQTLFSIRCSICFGLHQSIIRSNFYKLYIPFGICRYMPKRLAVVWLQPPPPKCNFVFHSSQKFFNVFISFAKTFSFDLTPWRLKLVMKEAQRFSPNYLATLVPRYLIMSSISQSSLISQFVFSFLKYSYCFNAQPVLRHVQSLFQTSSPQTAIQCFLFQFTVRSSSSCLRILPRLSVSSVLPSIFPSVTCFKSQFFRQHMTPYR